MFKIEIRTGREARCWYCSRGISKDERRVITEHGPRQYVFPRSYHVSCFVQHNRLAISQLAYELNLIDKERLDYILSTSAGMVEC